MVREEHEGDVNCVAVKGDVIVSGGDDEKIKIWRLTKE